MGMTAHRAIGKVRDRRHRPVVCQAASNTAGLRSLSARVAYRRGGGPLAITLAHPGLCFDRVGHPDVSASLYGASKRYDSIVAVPGFPE